MKLSDYLSNPNLLFLIFFFLGVLFWIGVYLLAEILDKYQIKRKRKQRLKELEEEKEIFTEFN